LKNLEAEMNFDLQRRYKILQNSLYNETEIIGIRNERKYWERGVILEHNINNAIEKQIPECVVRLIDRGPVVTVSASEVCALPKMYAAPHPFVSSTFKLVLYRHQKVMSYYIVNWMFD
jgi:hypothetical protein